MSNYLPVIGITMGDAAGVGAEVVVKSLAYPQVYAQCRPLVIGDARRLERANTLVGGAMKIRRIEHAGQALYEQGTIDCIDINLIPDDLPFGQLSAVAGDAAYQFIKRAVELAQAGEIDAICTAPLNKEALHAGGHKYPGHTEMLAHLTGVDEVSMMLVAPQLRVIHVTTHIGIIDAIRKIEPGLVQRTIERGYTTLVKSGIARPRIGVCGINPHAGENGLFGYGEEEEKIIPAIEILQERGLDVTGPLPADTLFYRAGRGDFDLVVAMYHDQGHGPVKVLGLEAGVNVTVGLEVIRTSVDHGTAFDIAGNLLAVMSLANAPGVRLTLIGGELRSQSMSTFGPLAELILGRLTVDIAFLGADGVVAEFGLCEATAQQAYMKECIVARAAEVIVLADSAKLGRARQQHWTPLLRDWRLIISSQSGEATLAPFREREEVTVELASGVELPPVA